MKTQSEKLFKVLSFVLLPLAIIYIGLAIYAISTILF